MIAVVEILKDIPVKEIEFFQDRVVYFSAVETREFTKMLGAYPHLSGTLEQEEVASQITGGNAEYNLLAGTNYAKYVWKMNDVKWTNPDTKPQWYYNIYKKYQKTISKIAENKAIREIK